MRKLVLLLIAILICSLAFGCAAPTTPVPAQQPPPPTPSTPPSSGVVTLDLFGFTTAKNWDADPEIDGIEVEIWPKDAKDEVVRAPGTVSAKLWLQKSLFESEKGELVQTWSGISIKKEDYGFIGGAKVRLEYSGFVPTEEQWGILEVTFTTLDGNSFTAREKDIHLGE
jgi:hypothetical protein